MSEISGHGVEGSDVPRESDSVRGGGRAPEVPVHAGDNPTMSLSELYEQRERREGASDTGASESGHGAGAGEGVRGSSAADSGAELDTGELGYDAAYPGDTGVSGAALGGYGADEVIDGQVVSGTVTDSDPVPDGAEAGNWDSSAGSAKEGWPGPDEGTRDSGDSRFTGQSDAEPTVAAADFADDRDGTAGRQEIDGSNGFFGRAGELQDQGVTEAGEREDDERAGPRTRTSADTSQQGEREAETGGEKDVEGQGEDGREERPTDLALVQHPVPDAETDRPAETSAEAAPDQLPDDPRMAAMEARMAEFASMFDSMQARIEASESRNEELEARLDASQARNEELEAKVSDLETGRQEDQAKIGELEARVERSDEVREPDVAGEGREHTESLINPDVIRSDEHVDHLSTAEQADDAELSDTAADRAGRAANGAPEEAERVGGYSEGAAQAGKDALSLAGSLGIVSPVVAMAVSADSARRDFQKMSLSDQLDVINLTDTTTRAFGSMPPEYAVVAVTLATAGPLVEDKARNLIRHFRRKD